MLFHVSEDPNIVEFKPQPSQYTQDPVVWAVNNEKMRNYLVPRDCPRVTYFAGAQTVPERLGALSRNECGCRRHRGELVESHSGLHAVQLSPAGGGVRVHRRVRGILRQP